MTAVLMHDDAQTNPPPPVIDEHGELHIDTVRQRRQVIDAILDASAWPILQEAMIHFLKCRVTIDKDPEYVIPAPVTCGREDKRWHIRDVHGCFVASFELRHHARQVMDLINDSWIAEAEEAP